jgi:alkylhydroperoxidase/carboxymuconolactone decarboxylase family protein YurZ
MTEKQEAVALAIEKLQKTCSMDAINTTLLELFDQAFTAAGYGERDHAVVGYTAAVSKAFYKKHEQLLRDRERECALIALLASQGADTNLGIHIFIALAAGMAVDDVVDLLFLTGIYCGANLLTKSLRVAEKTFAAIIQAAADGVDGPKPVIRAIAARFA